MKKNEPAVKKGRENFLAVDAGNSVTRFGLFCGEKFEGCVDIASADVLPRSADRLAGEITGLNGGLKADSCIIGSVAPALNMFLIDVCQRACLSKPVLLSHDMDSGVRFKYENPAELGLDRFAAAAACRKLYPGEDVIIIDAGTALTFGVLKRTGEFEGGMIVPGPGLQAEVLAEKTALLPVVKIYKPQTLIATNTAAGIQSGVFYCFLDSVEGMVRRLKRELKLNFKVIAAGGWAGLLAEHSAEIDEVDPILVLKGLRIIHERNLKP